MSKKVATMHLETKEVCVHKSASAAARYMGVEKTTVYKAIDYGNNHVKHTWLVGYASDDSPINWEKELARYTKIYNSITVYDTITKLCTVYKNKSAACKVIGVSNPGISTSMRLGRYRIKHCIVSKTQDQSPKLYQLLLDNDFTPSWKPSGQRSSI